MQMKTLMQMSETTSKRLKTTSKAISNRTLTSKKSYQSLKFNLNIYTILKRLNYHYKR